MKVVKEFTMEEGTIQGGYYLIIIKDWGGKEVERFERDTMKQAHQDMENAGYRFVPDSTPVTSRS